MIEQYEYCLAIGESGCGGCRYRDEDGVCRMRENALPYLKQYRSDKAMWEADRKGYQDWIEQYKDARDKHQQAVIELKRKLLAKVKEPARDVNGNLWGRCGNCGALVYSNYCPRCGAKLDWSEK